MSGADDRPARGDAPAGASPRPSLEERSARALEAFGDDPAHVLAIVGPTASGKTDLALRIAEITGAEIVGIDSVQVVRHFDLGSGKPTAAERARARHHLLDVFEPHDPVDAARVASLADAAIADIRARGHRVIVCGGTFLWVKALLQGLAEAPPADEAIRARHREEAARDGRPSLHARLAFVDPSAAARLHPNDLVRVSRALEVHELTGRPITDLQADHGFRGARYHATFVAPQVSSDVLTERITARVRDWLASGWIDEVRALLARGFGDTRAMGSVGYREIRSYLAGELPEIDLEPAIVRATRVFARRQRTWLRSASVREI